MVSVFAPLVTPPLPVSERRLAAAPRETVPLSARLVTPEPSAVALFRLSVLVEPTVTVNPLVMLLAAVARVSAPLPARVIEFAAFADVRAPRVRAMLPAEGLVMVKFEAPVIVVAPKVTPDVPLPRSDSRQERPSASENQWRVSRIRRRRGWYRSADPG